MYERKERKSWWRQMMILIFTVVFAGVFIWMVGAYNDNKIA